MPKHPRTLVLPGRGGRDLALNATTPRIMGVLNLTPDSFSDGGRHAVPHLALSQAARLEADGADILDLGAESSRPGSSSVSAEEELARLMPVLLELRPRTERTISIDTTKASVARAALEAGADWINDISALAHDPELVHVVADFDVPIVLMHMRRTPKTMQDAPQYEDVVNEVRAELAQRVEFCLHAGIREDRILLDPGIGFGKGHEDNLELLRNLDALSSLGFPLLLGVSRKSLLGTLLAAHGIDRGAEERDAATLAVLAEGHRQGVAVHRVHNARYAKDFLTTLCGLAGVPMVTERSD